MGWLKLARGKGVARSLNDRIFGRETERKRLLSRRDLCLRSAIAMRGRKKKPDRKHQLDEREVLSGGEAFPLL